MTKIFLSHDNAVFEIFFGRLAFAEIILELLTVWRQIVVHKTDS